MLTAYQCAIGGYYTENGELLCERCAMSGDDFVKPISNYGLDEEQQYRSEGWLDWDYEAEEIRETEDGRFALIHGRWHVEGCGCQQALWCDGCSGELVEEYIDYTCRGDDEPVPNPAVPRWVPCSRCGAGDGQPHREGCGYLQPEEG